MTRQNLYESMLALPIGTQIVTRVSLPAENTAKTLPTGTVGVVVAGPTQASMRYVLRFPGGEQATAARGDLTIRKHLTRLPPSAVGEALTLETLRPYVMYRCVIGSRAYGLEHEESDTDRRGIYLPPAEMHWSLAGVPEQVEADATQECYWELEKCIRLALKANPNVLECLYSPHVETMTPLAAELLAMREIFMSRQVYQTYNGYVLSQFKKLEQDLRAGGEIKWKHAMHLIRLLLSGITALRDGYVPVRVEHDRDRLLAIRHGELPWESVNAWRLALHAAFDRALHATCLPPQPDFRRANDFLVRARGSMVEPVHATEM